MTVWNIISQATDPANNWWVPLLGGSSAGFVISVAANVAQWKRSLAMQDILFQLMESSTACINKTIQAREDDQKAAEQHRTFIANEVSAAKSQLDEIQRGVSEHNTLHIKERKDA